YQHLPATCRGGAGGRPYHSNSGRCSLKVPRSRRAKAKSRGLVKMPGAFKMAGTLVGLYVRSFAKIILVLQRLTDYAMESAAGVKRICLGDVGESKQQALPARMRCR